jgi:hypothetical protein
MDQQFIELFESSAVQVDAKYIPSWPELENDEFPPIDHSTYWIPFESVIIRHDDREDEN